MGEQNSTGSGDGSRWSLRGVSPVVGFALLVGIAVVAVGILLVIGSGLVAETQSHGETEQASAAMEQLANDVHDSDSTDVALPGDGTARADPGAGYVTVAVGGDTVVDANGGSLGAVYYETGDTTLAYQGGGVFRRDGGQNATVVTPPPIQYTNGSEPTLALPIVSVEAGHAVADPDRLTSLQTDTAYPTAALDNPVTEPVVITVHSEFYRAWGRYLAERLDATVTYDHGASNATVTLNGAERETIWSGADAPAIPSFLYHDSDAFNVSNTVEIDSYNSSDGPYGASGPRSNGNVVAVAPSEFLLTNDVVVRGSVDAVGDADLNSDLEIYGPVRIDETGASTRVSGSNLVLHDNLSTTGDLEITSGSTVEGDATIVGGDFGYFDGEILGDLYVHGDATNWAASGAEIHGDVYVVGQEDLSDPSHPVTVHGTVYDSPTPGQMRDPVQPRTDVERPDVDVQSVVSTIEDDNDNADTTTISPGTDELTGCAGGCTLTSGEYYLSEFELRATSNEEMIIDARDGPVRIAVDGPTTIENTEIEVLHDDSDPHPVEFYLGGEYTQYSTDPTEPAVVDVDGHRAAVVQMYAAPGANWEIGGHSEFTGIVYAYDDGSEEATIDLKGDSGAVFRGAALGAIDRFDNDMAYHHDEALATDDLLGRTPYAGDGPTTVTTFDDADVGYLHVTRERVAAD